jgi:tRNA G26 N,N-dimethylase Trm1
MNYNREKFNKPDKTNCITATSTNKLVTPNAWIGQLHAHEILQEAMEADHESHKRVQWLLLLQHLNTHLSTL